MGVLRPSCWTKDSSNTYYVLAFGYDHTADKASGTATELAILLKGTHDLTNASNNFAWTVVATTPKASLSFPSTAECTVSPAGIFTTLQMYETEPAGNNTRLRTLAGFQYSPSAGSGAWSTILAGSLDKGINWSVFSLPVSEGSQEHATDQQAANIFLKHGAGSLHGLMWVWKGGAPNPTGENLSYTFKVPLTTAAIPPLPAQVPIYNVTLSGDCHYANNTRVAVDKYFLFTCREQQFRHLFRFNGTGYDTMVDIDLRVAPQAYEAALDSNGQPLLYVVPKESNKLDKFLYEGVDVKLSFPSVKENLFYYTLGDPNAPPPSDNNNSNNSNNNGGNTPDKVASSSISGGAIAGIVVGAVVAIAAALFTVRHLKKRKKSQSQSQSQSQHETKDQDQNPTNAYQEPKKDNTGNSPQFGQDPYQPPSQQPLQDQPQYQFFQPTPVYVPPAMDDGKILEDDIWHYPVLHQAPTEPFSPSVNVNGSASSTTSSPMPHIAPPISADKGKDKAPPAAYVPYSKRPLVDVASAIGNKPPTVPNATRPRAPQEM
ncbi:hypothetical protein BGZ73_006440 [Actinomortierella ambigua]|nr:hypothetical protein BGZ73_006440 [Actinomortierella ambigua]